MRHGLHLGLSPTWNTVFLCQLRGHMGAPSDAKHHRAMGAVANCTQSVGPPLVNCQLLRGSSEDNRVQIQAPARALLIGSICSEQHLPGFIRVARRLLLKHAKQRVVAENSCINALEESAWLQKCTRRPQTVTLCRFGQPHRLQAPCTESVRPPRSIIMSL